MQPASVFHQYEIKMQSLAMKPADVLHMAEVGRSFIRSFMPQQHVDFYCNQQVLLSCVTDGQGRPVAAALVGSPAYVTCPSSTHLRLKPSHPLDPGTASDSLQA